MAEKMTRLLGRRNMTDAEAAERFRRLVSDLAEMWEVTEAETCRRLARALDDPPGSPRPWPSNAEA